MYTQYIYIYYINIVTMYTQYIYIYYDRGPHNWTRSRSKTPQTAPTVQRTVSNPSTKTYTLN